MSVIAFLLWPHHKSTCSKKRAFMLWKAPHAAIVGRPVANLGFAHPLLSQWQDDRDKSWMPVHLKTCLSTYPQRSVCTEGSRDLLRKMLSVVSFRGRSALGTCLPYWFWSLLGNCNCFLRKLQSGGSARLQDYLVPSLSASMRAFCFSPVEGREGSDCVSAGQDWTRSCMKGCKEGLSREKLMMSGSSEPGSPLRETAARPGEVPRIPVCSETAELGSGLWAAAAAVNPPAVVL